MASVPLSGQPNSAVSMATSVVSAGSPSVSSMTTTHGIVSSVPTMKVMQPISVPPIGTDANQVLNKQRLQDLVREVDINEQLDDDVEEMLLQIADDFIENVVTNSCLLAKHRKANTLEVRDVQLNLEKNWNIWIPGFGSDELRPYKKSASTESHKQRMALIRKTLKKY